MANRTWIDLLFYNEETGEEFFVELDTEGGSKTKDELKKEAWAIIEENFDSDDLASIRFQCFTSPEYAEQLGYDTY